MPSAFWSEVRSVTTGYTGHSFGTSESHIDVPCAHCGGTPINKVAELGENAAAAFCPHCRKPTVIWANDDWEVFIAPHQQPEPAPEGTPENIQATWHEGELCYHAGAYNAAALMYRKIIFLTAVDHGLPAKNAKGWAPNFDKCLNHLETEGFFTSRQRETWAEAIRLIGNEATHEIEPISSDQAKASRVFTRMVLTIVYENELVARRATGQ